MLKAKLEHKLFPLINYFFPPICFQNYFTHKLLILLVATHLISHIYYNQSTTTKHLSKELDYQERGRDGWCVTSSCARRSETSCFSGKVGRDWTPTMGSVQWEEPHMQGLTLNSG